MVANKDKGTVQFYKDDLAKIHKLRKLLAPKLDRRRLNLDEAVMHAVDKEIRLVERQAKNAKG